MDFSLLSESELTEFLNQFRTRSFSKYIQSEPDKVKQAEKLFELAQQNPNFNYPLPIIDLYLASQYSGPRDQKYFQEDLENLTEADVNYLDQFLHFDAGLYPLNINRQRIQRIFRYLGILDETPQILEPVIPEPVVPAPEPVKSDLTPEQFGILITGTVWGSLRQNLSRNDLKSLLVSSEFTKNISEIPITDPNGYIRKLSKLDNLTIDLMDLIEKLGSAGALIESIVYFNHDALRRLLELGVPPDFYYLYEENIRAKRDFNELAPLTPLLTAVLTQNGEAIKILVQMGANVNGFWLNGFDFKQYRGFDWQLSQAFNFDSFQNPLSMSVRSYLLTLNFVPNGKIVINPTQQILNSYPGFQDQEIKTRNWKSSFTWLYHRLLSKKHKGQLLQIKIVELLLSLGADPNGAGFCPSPLMLSTDLKITKMLISAGADVNLICPSRYGNTALAVAAVYESNYEITRHLLSQKADPNLIQLPKNKSLSLQILHLFERYGIDISLFQ